MRIISLPGDGVGPEVMTQARRVLDVVADAAGTTIEVAEFPFGGAAIDSHGEPFPQEVADLIPSADAVLLGAVGGPKWDSVALDKRPERGLLSLRKALGVYANLRPAKFFSALADASPLRPERTAGVDVMIVRELLGGIYFGEPREDHGDEAFDTMRYSVSEVQRVAKIGFELAQTRGGKLTSVDKANVLASMRLWRRTVEEMKADYADVAVDYEYVDAAAMRMVTNPASFDVIVTGNMFGDILSDAAAALTGSLGMLPSASVGDGPSMYEPIHGSAPDIAGQHIANPLGTILSVGMFTGITLERVDIEKAIAAAVDRTLNDGIRTRDIAGSGDKVVGTVEMGDAVVAHLKAILDGGGA